MTVQIPLTRGLVALIDDGDALVVSELKWYAEPDHNTFYALRKSRRPDGSQATVRLHAFLTGWPLTDHINGDGLDNRRANLREATRAENGRNRGPQQNNTSGYKGVAQHKQTRKWQAQISIDGRYRYLGLHVSPEAAADAYDSAARELHGEFARLNFPINGERSA